MAVGCPAPEAAPSQSCAHPTCAWRWPWFHTRCCRTAAACWLVIVVPDASRRPPAGPRSREGTTVPPTPPASTDHASGAGPAPKIAMPSPTPARSALFLHRRRPYADRPQLAWRRSAGDIRKWDLPIRGVRAKAGASPTHAASDPVVEAEYDRVVRACASGGMCGSRRRKRNTRRRCLLTPPARQTYCSCAGRRTRIRCGTISFAVPPCRA